MTTSANFLQSTLLNFTSKVSYRHLLSVSIKSKPAATILLVTTANFLQLKLAEVTAGNSSLQILSWSLQKPEKQEA